MTMICLNSNRGLDDSISSLNIKIFREEFYDWRTYMDISSSVSVRNIRSNDAFMKIVYEWEDYISEAYNLPIHLIENQNRFIFKLKRKYKNLFSKRIKRNESIELAFVIHPCDLRYYFNKNCIFVFIDIWPDDEKGLVRRMGKKTPFFVTSLDVYEHFKLKFNMNNVYYMPLSISDVWKLKKVPEKRIDLVQIGRKNEILHNFAIRYVKENPQVDYVYSDMNWTMDRRIYTSTKYGAFGDVDTRDDYMNLLKESKICVLSSPGVDGSRPQCKDMDYPTPRFYESAINYCHMVGRYSDNEEFKMQKIPNVCMKVDTYEDFKQYVNQILKGGYSFPVDKWDEFINLHLTSKWYSDFLKKCEGL